MKSMSIVDRDGARRADLAAIHIAKKELGWDDGTYRDVMFAVCRVKSSGDLDFTGRKVFLAHLRTCLKQMSSASGPDRVARSMAIIATARRDRKPLTAPQRKMWSLWQQLAEAGKVESRKMPALVAFSQRQTGVDRLEWLNGDQEQLVLESLKAWLRRPGGAV